MRIRRRISLRSNVDLGGPKIGENAPLAFVPIESLHEYLLAKCLSEEKLSRMSRL
jgi:hypothetical protein